MNLQKHILKTDSGNLANKIGEIRCLILLLFPILFISFPSFSSSKEHKTFLSDGLNCICIQNDTLSLWLFNPDFYMWKPMPESYLKKQLCIMNRIDRNVYQLKALNTPMDMMLEDSQITCDRIDSVPNDSILVEVELGDGDLRGLVMDLSKGTQVSEIYVENSSFSKMISNRIGDFSFAFRLEEYYSTMPRGKFYGVLLLASYYAPLRKIFEKVEWDDVNHIKIQLPQMSNDLFDYYYLDNAVIYYNGKKLLLYSSVFKRISEKEATKKFFIH